MLKQLNFQGALRFPGKVRATMIPARALFVLLVFVLLALPANAAICGGGNTVFIRLPANWNNSLLIWADQFVTPVGVTVEGEWLRVPLVGGPTHNVQAFAFFRTRDGWNDSKIYRTAYNTTQNLQGVVGVNFTCADFQGGNVLYISENLSAPGTTTFSTMPPNAQYFYFLPPDDDDWYQGSAVMQIDGGAQQITMNPDPTRCGWYRAIYFNQAPPTNVVLTLDVDPENQRVGNLGTHEDVPTPINLYERFANMAADAGGAKHLFFEAEQGPEGWTTVDPGIVRSCDYALAAYIYDTDASLHGGFTCDNHPVQATTACPTPLTFRPNTVPCIGVTPGIVMPQLGPDEKPIYNPTSGCFSSPEAFNSLFRSTPGTNVEHCRDIRFTRAADGLWEYDSQNETDMGYYPLEHVPNSGAGFKRHARGAVMLDTAWTRIDPTTGLPRFDTRPTLPGEFATGDLPPVWDNATWDLRVGGNVGTPQAITRNQHFCFESKAEFVYRPGQRFYFRGDDDIWVFINRRLVVDLGGTHLAAPAWVNLDTIGMDTIGITSAQPLTPGNSYPIHIFFCDRRTDMSNIRIKTNMYFSQRTGFYARPDPANQDRRTMCLEETGGSSCAAQMGGVATVTRCGAEIYRMVGFYLVDRRGDTLRLNAANPACNEGATSLVCYGGITLGQGEVTFESQRLNGLAGTYTLWAAYLDPTRQVPPTRIRRFTTQTDVAVISGPADLDGQQLSFNPQLSGMAGARIPVHFASGVMDPAGRFIIDTENGPGKTFMVGGMLRNASIGAELQIYTTATGGTAVLPNHSFTIPESGICTVWVAGNYEAQQDFVYSVNAVGASGTPVQVAVRLPRLRFVDATFTTPVNPVGSPNPSLSIPIMMGIDLPMYLEAFDPLDGSRCLTCTFSLVGTSTVRDTTIPPPVQFFGLSQRVNEFGQATGGVINGVASISITGVEAVLNPYWASLMISGRSVLTSASWDSLQFRAPPVPFPRSALLFDRNGDGIADSLAVIFNRALPADSLPDFLEIWWPETSDSLFLAGSRPDPSQQIFLAPTENRLLPYWRQNGNPDSILSIADRDFSPEILTAGSGRVRSTMTYEDPDNQQIISLPTSRQIEDRIPAVIVKAVHHANCISRDVCLDQIQVELSEPVTLDTINQAESNVFQFRFLESMLWQDNVVPQVLSRLPIDSNATLSYTRSLVVGAVRTPVALDSIKLRPGLLRDLHGNFANPREIGARIQGIKPLTVAVVAMTNLNPADYPERLQQTPVQLFPVLPGLPIDSVRARYPGTIGFLVELDVPGRILTLELESGGIISVEPSAISMEIEVFYYTNLGAFVAKGSQRLQCTDAFFDGNCIDNPRHIYAAWNLVSSEGRFVGSGAYVSNLKFSWKVTMPTGTVLTPDKRDITRILGVRRGPGIIN